MNIPNALTLSRLVLAFALIPLLVLPYPFFKTLALAVFSVSGVTDYLDGHLARNVYGTTPFGSLMDPVTDKIMVCAAFVTFVELDLVAAAVAIIIISREFMVTGLRLLALEKGRVIAAGRWGKHKTVWQIVAIVIILLGLAVRDDVLRRAGADTLAVYNRVLGGTAHAVSIGVALITVISGWMYLREHRDMITRNLQGCPAAAKENR